MRTKHIAFMALLVAVVLMFTGCDALITNVFKTANLGQPSVTTIQTMPTTSLIAASGLSTGTVSPTFIATVISDPTTRDAVVATLEATFGGASSTPTEVQEAGTVLISIILAENNIDDIMTQLGSSLPDLLSSFGIKSLRTSKEIDYVALLNTLFPAGSNVANMIDTLVGLKPKFDILAASIAAHPGILSQSTVANFLPYAVISLAADNLQGTGPSNTKINRTYFPTETIGEVMASLLDAFRAASDPSTIQFDHYFTSPPDIATLAADGSTLAIFFDASGMGSLLTQLQSL